MRIYEVVFIVIAVLMSLVYCGLGVVFFLGKFKIFETMPILNIVFGVAFVAYGLFRGWRVYQKIEDFKGE